MKRFLATAFLAAIAWAPVGASLAPAGAQQVERIAAVVNDEAISILDLEMRIRLALMSSSMPDTIEMRQRVLPQVLRKLIDERLQLQEASRQGITVTETELRDGMAMIERQNDMPQGGLEQLLRENGILPQSMYQQIRAEISWVKLVRRNFAGTISIGDEEVNAQLDMLRQAHGKPEYLLSEIFLSFESGQREDEVRNLGLRLIEEMRNGAPFPALAHQFSQSPTAATGGDMGWVTSGTLEEELEQVVRSLRPGEVSGLIRTPNGYYILALRERGIVGGDAAGTELELARLLVPVPPNASEAQLNQAAQQAASWGSRASSCEDLVRVAEETRAPSSGLMGKIRLGDLPQYLLPAVLPLDNNQPSAPVLMEDGIAILMVCSRDVPAGALPSRQQISESLLDQRMDMMARRLLRDLRRQAFIDVRI
ncbi:peptidylprolyl isomerase [Telmatospirillum sp. J64-1]|uniref:peptidylprolyl isomerase n=1 Tax=Telmatospirillum sp. J64-1 TaxID=2502183 RepID=UPI00163D428E|nr:peptidylprolyl isomerase [Telmatospirillum sp. J64-1]